MTASTAYKKWPLEKLPTWLLADLRSDHAGETGAVFIYRGILSCSRDPEVRRFASEHLQTEWHHLEVLDRLLSKKSESWLLPVWRVAGFLTGSLPALFGRRAVFATIAEVERFVDSHYQEQINQLDQQQLLPGIRALLEEFRQDEVEHRDEASDLIGSRPGPLLRAWCKLVAIGAAAAVNLARWR